MGIFDRVRRWFSEGALPSAESQAWLIEAWTWLFAHAPLPDQLKNASLVQPTAADFPLTTPDDPVRAQQVFEMVLAHCGMRGWDCDLVAQPRAMSTQLHEKGIYLDAGSSDPGGTFLETDTGPIITYEPDFCSDLTVLIAVLAHEVGHLRLSRAAARRPWVPDAEEPLTDLCAIAMGFGIFLCNTAVISESYEDGIKAGFRITRSGYLSERERAFALALFTEIQQRSPRPVAQTLKSNPRRAYLSSVACIRDEHAAALQRLRAYRTDASVQSLLDGALRRPRDPDPSMSDQ